MSYNRFSVRIITPILLGVVSVCSSAGQTSVTVLPSPKYVSPSETFTVGVSVGAVTNLKAAKAVFTFDNTVLRYVKADKGPVCSDLFQRLPPAGSGVNQVEVDQSSTATGGVSGPGILFTITFEALQAGSSPVMLSLVELRDPLNNTIPSSSISGIVSTALVSVSPATQTIPLANPVNVDIMVTNVSHLHAPYLCVTFDKNALRYDSVHIGPFMASNGDGIFSHSRVASGSTHDTVKVDQAILGPGGVSGTGLLFTLWFTPLTAGTTSINISKVILSDTTASPIPSIAQQGAVTIINNLAVNARVFLEGPFAGGSMRTLLNSSGYLPVAQPYGGAPWNYNGGENVAGGFFAAHTTIVDWMLVELRTGTPPTMTTAGMRAAFLNSDGTLVDIDGSSQVSFPGLSPGSYFIVIRHRNHLAVMSSGAVSLGSTSSTLYDFTAGTNMYYGTEAKDLGGGKYGMYAGDADGSGYVDANDRTMTWNDRNLGGYRGSDLDMTNLVDANDRNISWNNRNLQARVP